MPRGSRFGRFFESVGAIAERWESRNQDPVRRNVRQACRYLLILTGFIALIVITYFTSRKNPLAFVVLGLDLLTAITAIWAMRTVAPVAAFLRLLLAILFLGLTFAATALIQSYL